MGSILAWEFPYAICAAPPPKKRVIKFSTILNVVTEVNRFTFKNCVWPSIGEAVGKRGYFGGELGRIETSAAAAGT